MRARQLLNCASSPMLTPPWPPIPKVLTRAMIRQAISTSQRSAFVSTFGGAIPASSCQAALSASVRWSGGLPSKPVGIGSFVRARFGFRLNASGVRSAVGLWIPAMLVFVFEVATKSKGGYRDTRMRIPAAPLQGALGVWYITRLARRVKAN